jgi:DNA-binding transcriptional MocR family regulator
MSKARYIQLADTFEAAINRGELLPGAKLPTHRAFAEHFNVALATATRTYGELERRGVIIGEAGRGTFVRDQAAPLTLGLQQTAADGSIDLVFNMPSDTSDAQTLRAGLKRLAAAGDLSAMLRYQPHSGRDHERHIIAKDLARTLGPIDPKSLLITSGGQHGLALVGLGLLAHGDTVATDALTYPGFKSVAALQGIDLVPIAEQAGVMDPDALEKHCRMGRLKAVYLMPTVHNPLGTVMDRETRQRITDIARHHDLLIIEDAAYAFLETAPPPSFLTLAPERTVHIGGFSKTLATGLRLGYVITPDKYIGKLVEAIRATTWNAPALISDLVTHWIVDGTLERFESKRRADGGERQKHCHDVLGHMPLMSHPNAGFVWVPLPQGLRAEPVVTSLKSLGIAVSSAAPFAVGPIVPQALRLAFGGVAEHDFKTALGAVRTALEQA